MTDKHVGTTACTVAQESCVKSTSMKKTWFLDEIILEETIFNPFLLTLLEQAKMAYKLPKNVNNRNDG